MVLIDFNNVFISAFSEEIKKPDVELNEVLIRKITLKVLKTYIRKYKSKFGEVVICFDSPQYWRRDFFPFYKAGRKKSREKSNIDWSLVFKLLNQVKNELKDVFPRKLLEVPGAEADDIIATLALKYYEPSLIISSDGDFVQLQASPSVSQFSPKISQYLKVEDPERYLKEHIIRGDISDGVPNILSDDDTFVTEKRQKSITKEKLQFWLDEPAFPEELNQNNIHRNVKLISLFNIPDDLTDSIIHTYETYKTQPKTKLLDYMIRYGCNELITDLEDF